MLALLACDLGLDLCHFDAEQAFVQSELKKSCVHPSAAGLRRAFRYGCQTRSKPLRLEAGIPLVAPAFNAGMKCLGFDQCAADACVMRLIEKGTIAVVVVVNVDGIGIFYWVEESV